MTERRFKLRKTEHEYADERLSTYLDGELPTRERARVEAHLQVCESCRAELSALRWTKGLLQRTPAVSLPRSFVLREVDVTPRPRAGRRRPLFGTQWATAVVALLFVLVLAGDLFTGFGLRGGQMAPSAPQFAYEAAETTAPTVEVAEEIVLEKKVVVQEAEAVAEAAEATAIPEAEEIEVQATPSPPAEDHLRAGAAERQVDRVGGTRVTTGTPLPAAVAAEGDKSEAMPTPSPAAMIERADETEFKEAPLPEEPPHPVESPSPTTPPTPEEQEWTQRPQEEGTPPPPTALRVGLRVAEIGLGVVLVGLLAAIVWMRRRE